MSYYWCSYMSFSFDKCCWTWFFLLLTFLVVLYYQDCRYYFFKSFLPLIVWLLLRLILKKRKDDDLMQKFQNHDYCNLASTKLFHSINMWLKNLKIFDCKFGLNVLSAELIPINVRNNLERSTTFYTKDALWHYTRSNEVFVPAICEILANFLFAYFFLTAISFPFSLALDVFTSNVAKSMMFSLIDSSG